MSQDIKAFYIDELLELAGQAIRDRRNYLDLPRAQYDQLGRMKMMSGAAIVTNHSRYRRGEVILGCVSVRCEEVRQLWLSDVTQRLGQLKRGIGSR